MAISDIGTLLFHSATGASASFTELFPISSAPATGSAPAKIDITTLKDTEKKYLSGRTERPDMEFDFMYTEANMALATGTEGDKHYFLIIYQDGSGALITGTSRAWIDAATQDAPIIGKLSVTPEGVDYKTAAEVTALKTA